MSNLSDRFTQYGLDLASSGTEYLSWDGSQTVYSAAGSAFPAPLGGTKAEYVLVPGSPIQSGEVMQLEVSVDQGEWTPAEHAFPYHEVGASKYGMRLRHSGTQLVVEFAGDGAQDGTDWSASGVLLDTGEETYTRWRVVRVTRSNISNPDVPLPLRNESTGDKSVGTGYTLTHPYLQIATADTYTVSGKLLVAEDLTSDGELIVSGDGEVIIYSLT